MPVSPFSHLCWDGAEARLAGRRVSYESNGCSSHDQLVAACYDPVARQRCDVGVLGYRADPVAHHIDEWTGMAYLYG